MNNRNSVLIAGTFHGAEIEPGTFHGAEIEPGTFHGAEIEPGTFHYLEVPDSVHPIHGTVTAHNGAMDDGAWVDDGDDSEGPAESDC